MTFVDFVDAFKGESRKNELNSLALLEPRLDFAREQGLAEALAWVPLAVTFHWNQMLIASLDDIQNMAGELVFIAKLVVEIGLEDESVWSGVDAVRRPRLDVSCAGAPRHPPFRQAGRDAIA
jgi:hypothetical protein